ncbi:hypothetical protein E6H15_01940 [Candidatus Bathyarchaeota archaeon]|nr:MAG: hypothetical protein E6H15_01940 [Candidatus Bathyarchaeota archaeon]
MKPETLAIFSFLVSLIAYEFVGLLLLYAAATSSSAGYSVVVTGPVIIAIFAVIGAFLTGLKVHAIERS